jgi:hypothetical protein
VTRHTVKLGEVHSDGVPKDGIPAIDAPRFEPIPSARQWPHPDEPVLPNRGQDFLTVSYVFSPAQ